MTDHRLELLLKFTKKLLTESEMLLARSISALHWTDRSIEDLRSQNLTCFERENVEALFATSHRHHHWRQQQIEKQLKERAGIEADVLENRQKLANSLGKLQSVERLVTADISESRKRLAKSAERQRQLSD